MGSVVEKAIAWALSIANDNSHGYDQNNRWGPDYDCSSLVISAFEEAGTQVKTKGATYTGNMKPVFLNCGFKDVTSSVNLATGAGLIRGDVLLHTVYHTALYLGDGQLVHASINEKGGARGGAVGDQTGREICTRNYYNRPWDCILRYEEDASAPAVTTSTTYSVNLPMLKRGGRVKQVKALQALLNGYGFNCGDIDGIFGIKTCNALISFQKEANIEADGICGPVTWKKLLRV